MHVEIPCVIVRAWFMRQQDSSVASVDGAGHHQFGVNFIPSMIQVPDRLLLVVISEDENFSSRHRFDVLLVGFGLRFETHVAQTIHYIVCTYPPLPVCGNKGLKAFWPITPQNQIFVTKVRICEHPCIFSNSLIIINLFSITQPNQLSIHIFMKPLVLSPGHVFGFWTVLREGERDKQGNRQLVCQCKCGNVCLVRVSSLRSHQSNQCGKCSRKENPNIRLRPYEALFNQAKKWAFKDGHKWTIQYEEYLELVQTPICHYCHSPVVFAQYCVNKNGKKYNLDRMDNTKGYLIDNVVVCCSRCNYAKGASYTYREWWAMTECFRLGF